jgi:hypothetical protein
MVFGLGYIKLMVEGGSWNVMLPTRWREEQDHGDPSQSHGTPAFHSPDQTSFSISLKE